MGILPKNALKRKIPKEWVWKQYPTIGKYLVKDPVHITHCYSLTNPLSQGGI